jgi:hypothetical protein
MVEVLLMVWTKDEDGDVLCERKCQMPFVPRTGDVITIDPAPSKEKLTELNDDMWLDDYGFLVYLVKLDFDGVGVFKYAVCYARVVDCDIDETTRFGENPLVEDEILPTTNQLRAAGWHIG